MTQSVCLCRYCLLGWTAVLVRLVGIPHLRPDRCWQAASVGLWRLAVDGGGGGGRVGYCLIRRLTAFGGPTPNGGTAGFPAVRGTAVRLPTVDEKDPPIIVGGW